MFLKKFAFASAHLSKSETTDMQCSSVSSHGMNFADTYVMPKSLFKIAWLEPEEIPSSRAPSLVPSL